MSTTENAAGATRSDTRTITVDASPADFFKFVAEPTNLPIWAVGFCRAIRREEETGRWLVTTGNGEIPVRLVADESSGTVDFHFAPEPGAEATAYSRVVPNGRGAEYVFTQFQPAGMPDHIFESQIRALVEELQVLRSAVHARYACRL